MVRCNVDLSSPRVESLKVTLNYVKSYGLSFKLQLILVVISHVKNWGWVDTKDKVNIFIILDRSSSDTYLNSVEFFNYKDESLILRTV